MADTINTGTMLIEEGVLMRGSLRFESEPWTTFYMAGEIIRESRKASGEQSQYASEGNMVHSDKVIDHYNHPRNAGSLPKDNPNVGPGLVGAECGHVMAKPVTQVVEEAEFGCGLAIANSSLPPNGSRARPRSGVNPAVRVVSLSGSCGCRKSGLDQRPMPLQGTAVRTIA